jgi:predicted Ser/Thr protein kinase
MEVGQLATLLVREVVNAVQGDAANEESVLCIRDLVVLIGENIQKIPPEDSNSIVHLEALVSHLHSAKEYCGKFTSQQKAFFSRLWRMGHHSKHKKEFEKLHADLKDSYDFFSKGLQVADYALNRSNEQALERIEKTMAVLALQDPQSAVGVGGKEHEDWWVDEDDITLMRDGEFPKELGKGASGVVYAGFLEPKATDGDAGVGTMDVAIKVVTFRNEADVEQFKNEIQITSAFLHPNLAKCFGGTYLFDPRTKRGKGKIVMELLVSTLLQHNLSVEDKFRYTCEIAKGLAYLHSNGVTHRDLKPENVMVDARGRCKLIDFGMAKRKADPAAESRATGAGKGTLPFMAPELLDPSNPGGTKPVDVYAYAILLFELWTGMMPFPGVRNLNPFVVAVCVFLFLWF